MRAERRFLARVAIASALLVGGVAAYAALDAPVAAKEDTLTGSAAPGGVTVNGSGYRYVAISPRTRPRLTVVERIDTTSGRVNRWWYLRGAWMVPAGAYDRSGAGLSADEGTLVLAAHSNGVYTVSGEQVRPPRLTRLAVLDTRLQLRHLPRRERGTRHAVNLITLRGSYEVGAVSPDGSVVYLNHYLRRTRRIDDFRAAAFSTATGRRLQGPSEPERQVQPAGVPVARVTSADGRWTYTLLYGPGRRPFVQALDTSAGKVSWTHLPQLHPGREPFGLRLRLGDDGRSLAVFRRDHSPDGHSPALASLPLPLHPSLRPPIAAAAEPSPPRDGPLGFLFTPVGRGNLMVRTGTAGESLRGRPIRVRQFGDPARPAVLVFGCIHGDECAARRLQPVFIESGGCPDPAANLVVVPDLDPDGFHAGTRLNADGVDLNRNFAAAWRPIGRPGDPQYAGPRPFSEPETGLAARLVRAVDPRVTVWFHQHSGPGAYVRAWGQSAPAGRRFARLAGIPFHLLPWPDGTAPHWQNHAFPGTASFVVELPPGPLGAGMARRLGIAEARLAHRVGDDGYVAKG